MNQNLIEQENQYLGKISPSNDNILVKYKDIINHTAKIVPKLLKSRHYSLENYIKSNSNEKEDKKIKPINNSLLVRRFKFSNEQLSKLNSTKHLKQAQTETLINIKFDIENKSNQQGQTYNSNIYEKNMNDQRSQNYLKTEVETLSLLNRSFNTSNYVNTNDQSSIDLDYQTTQITQNSDLKTTIFRNSRFKSVNHMELTNEYKVIDKVPSSNLIIKRKNKSASNYENDKEVKEYSCQSRIPTIEGFYKAKTSNRNENKNDNTCNSPDNTEEYKLKSSFYKNLPNIFNNTTQLLKYECPNLIHASNFDTKISLKKVKSDSKKKHTTKELNTLNLFDLNTKTDANLLTNHDLTCQTNYQNQNLKTECFNPKTIKVDKKFIAKLKKNGIKVNY